MANDIFASLDSLEAKRQPPPPDSFVVVLGSPSGGKTSLIASWLGAPAVAAQQRASNSSTEAPPTFAPTIGLEYYSLRNPQPAASGAANPSPPRDLAHVWELGGGSPAITGELLAIPLTPARLPTAVAVVVLDLARPGDLCASALRLVAALRRRTDDCLERMRKAREKEGNGGAGSINPPEALLITAAQARLHAGFAGRPLSPNEVAQHPDWLAILSPSGAILPLPALVVGAKWDALRDEPAPKRRAVVAALRFVALCCGAHCLTTSQSDKQSLNNFKCAVMSACFGLSDTMKSVDESAAYPISMPAGADSLDAILALLNGNGSGAALAARSDRGVEPTPLLSRAAVESAGARLPSVASAGAPEAAVMPVFAAKLELFATHVRQFYQASPSTPADVEDVAASQQAGGSGGGSKSAAVNFTDEAAVLFPEPRVDELRATKAQALAAFLAEAKERERRRALEARAAEKGAGSASAKAS